MHSGNSLSSIVIWLDTSNTAQVAGNVKADKIWIIDLCHQQGFCYIIPGKSGHKYIVL